MTISSLLFGAAHGLNPHATLLGVTNLALFGGVLALLALRDGGLIEMAVIVAGIALLLAYRARLVKNAPQDPLTS